LSKNSKREGGKRSAPCGNPELRSPDSVSLQMRGNPSTPDLLGVNSVTTRLLRFGLLK